jgi:predicted transposase YdaD
MANDYDKIFKENFDAIYLSFSKRFIDANFEKAEELGTDIQRTKEKKTDFLRKMLYASPSKNFILHAEIQTKDDPNMIYRMMEYHAMLLSKYKISVIQLVFYFGKGISKMQNVYKDANNYFRYELISIQQFSYRIFLESERPEELILAILADFENCTAEQIADLIFARAKVIVNETFGIEKFVNQIEVISKIRNLGNFIQKYIEKNMTLELKLEDSFTYKKGKREGRREGKREGKREGEKENRDKMILAMLKKEKYSIKEISEIAEVSAEYIKALAEQAKK